MKIRTALLIATCTMATGACATVKDQWRGPKLEAPKPTTHLALVPQSPLAQGKPVTVIAKINHIEERVMLTQDDLESTHGEKVQILLADPTLTDYQHLQATPTQTPGVFSFQFTPKLAGPYRAWADITPRLSKKEEFPAADLGRPLAKIARQNASEATISGYHFALSFNEAPMAGEESTGTIRAEGGGNATLEHIVAFYDDYRTVVHPPSAGALSFKLTPYRAGFIKIFAQVRIDGKEVIVPFGITAVPRD